jgi:hypothetical protein
MRRIDTVTILLNGGPVTIPWASREALLAECGKLDSMRPAINEFRNAGTSRPVKLAANERAGLLAVIVAWADAEGGYDGLPVGVPELCEAIRDDPPDISFA